MFGFAGSIMGLIILFIGIWAIIVILNGSQKTMTKALWIVLIIVLPIIGLVLWFLLGRR